jgi:Ca2+-binding EF-hand superfamily protein
MQFDKNLDDRIDIEELQSFLDSNLKNNKKFDPALTQKIFSLLDLDHDNKISCEEFIKTYMQIDDEIRSHSKDLTTKYNKEKDNNEKLFKLMMEHKNEKLNSDEIGSNAKVSIEITDIEFLNELEEYDAIFIRITFADIPKQTKTITEFIHGSKVSLNEKFE